MQATIYSIWLTLYIIPFAALVASSGRRSFSIVAFVMTAGLGLLWLDLSLVPFEDRGLGYEVSKGAITTMAVGAAAGLVARVLTVATGWSRFRSLGLSTTLLALVVAPFYLAISAGWDRWQRRPPTAECIARPSFDIQLADQRISIPNWPLVMVSAGDEHFSLSSPTGQRRLCERAGNEIPTTADSATFFFDHVTSKPLQGGVKAWADRECRDAAERVAANLVCGERPIEQLSIYADADFAGRTMAFGRISSHASFARQRADGHYAPDEALRHPTALEYPDGVWAFDDGMVVRCRMSLNGYPSCQGDIVLAPNLLAKVEFNAWHGDVEDAQRKARNAAIRLHAEIRRSTD